VDGLEGLEHLKEERDKKYLIENPYQIHLPVFNGFTLQIYRSIYLQFFLRVSSWFFISMAIKKKSEKKILSPKAIYNQDLLSTQSS